MQYRKHYKCVGEKGIGQEIALKKWDQISEAAICKYDNADEDERLKPEEIGIKKYKINQGLKLAHPLEHTLFFDKKSQNDKPHKLDKITLDSMLPKVNQVWIVRCFIKSQGEDKQTQAWKIFNRYCEEELNGKAQQIKNTQPSQVLKLS